MAQMFCLTPLCDAEVEKGEGEKETSRWMNLGWHYAKGETVLVTSVMDLREVLPELGDEENLRGSERRDLLKAIQVNSGSGILIVVFGIHVRAVGKTATTSFGGDEMHGH
jgi:hypothetical protein